MAPQLLQPAAQQAEMGTFICSNLPWSMSSRHEPPGRAMMRQFKEQKSTAAAAAFIVGVVGAVLPPYPAIGAPAQSHQKRLWAAGNWGRCRTWL